MLIYPQGLLRGDRLAECSDEAKLHFPRLAALANGHGRMELNARLILENAYADFTTKPTREQLMEWLKEYAVNSLLLPYASTDGKQWGQWCGIPENALPRYKTASDNKSPSPPADAVETFNAIYAAKKWERSASCEDVLDISESFQNVPEGSEASETFPRVVVGVGGVVEEEKQRQEPAALLVLEANSQTKGKQVFTQADAETVWQTWPNNSGKREGIASILKALCHLQQLGKPDPLADLLARVDAWMKARARKTAAGEFVPSVGFAQGWFGDRQRRYLDPDAEPAPPVYVRTNEGRTMTLTECESEGWIDMRGNAA